MMEHDELREFSPQAVEILKEIKIIWSKLQKEPYGTYVTGEIYLSPSSANYVYNVEELGKQVGKLCDETSNRFLTESQQLFHTINKEVVYVKHYHYDSRKSRGKNNADLSDLMRKANDQIALDLFSIFQLTDIL